MNTPKIFLLIESELLTGQLSAVDDSTTGSLIILKSVQRFLGRDPEYDLTQYFTDVTRRVTIPNSWKTTLKTA
jgi:hypothetical protein